MVSRFFMFDNKGFVVYNNKDPIIWRLIYMAITDILNIIAIVGVIIALWIVKNLKLKRENDILKNIMKQTYNKCGVELQNFIEQQLNNTNITDVVGKEEEGE